MSQNICNICGANYEYRKGRWVCPACGAYKQEELSSEEVTLLYNAAQKLRLNSFDDAEDLYRDIVRKYPENSDGYWGLVLSKYGIKYEEDYDGKMIPTCYAASYDSIMEDRNFKLALDFADEEKKKYYKEQAEKIESIRKEWVEKASKEPPYDVFISYKATELDNDIARTEDSHDAFEIYTYLEKKGYKVFFSRETLKEKIGEKYEPYIFNALNTASVMLIFGSKIEYIESTWVKNEWSRFYKRIKDKKKQENSMAVLYKGLNPGNLPRPLSSVQCMDVSSITFLHDLDSYVSRVVKASNSTTAHIERLDIKQRKKKGKGETVKMETVELLSIDNKGKKQASRERTVVETREIGNYKVAKLSASAENNLKIAFSCLGMGAFKDALARFDEFLINNKKNGKALLGKLLAIYSNKNIDEFINNSLINIKAEDFELLIAVLDSSEKDDSNKILSKLCNVVKTYVLNKDYNKAKEIYVQIFDYDNSDVFELRDYLFKASLSILQSSYDNAEIFIDKALAYEKNIDEYIIKLHSVVDKLIFLENYSNARKFVDLLLEVDEYGYKTQIQSLKIKYKSKKEFGFLQKIDDKKEHYVLEEILEKFASNDVVSWLKLQISFAEKLIREDKFESAIIWLSSVFKYKFEGRNEQVNNIFNLIYEKSNDTTSKLFEKMLSFSDEEVVKERLISYANSLLKHKSFNSAAKYFDLILDIEEDTYAYLGKMYASTLSRDKKEFFINLKDITDFTAIEEYLASIKINKDLLKVLDEFLTICVCNVKSLDNENDNNFVVFERLASYISEENNDTLLKHLKNIAKECQKKKYFDKAERYFALVLGMSPEDHSAYWGLLQSKLKCVNDTEVIKNETSIKDLPEFNNALLAAGSNQAALNGYISVRLEQEKYFIALKKKKKRIKFTKIACLVLVIIMAITGVAITGVNHYKKQSNLIYSLVNNGSGYTVKGGSLYDAQETVIIPETYNGKPVVEISNDAFKAQTNLRNIILPLTIVRIGNSAFEGCSELENIYFENKEGSTQTVSLQKLNYNVNFLSQPSSEVETTTLKEIGDRAFFGCGKLTVFALELGLERIGANAFNGTNLSIIDIPSSVVYVGSNVFGDCDNLSQIIVSNRDEVPHNWATNWNEGKEGITEFKLRLDFDYSGATGSIDKTFDYITKGNNFVLPVTTKNGYTFEGWYFGEEKITDNIGNSISVWTHDTGGIVKANWIANVNNLIFNANTGSGEMNNQEIATDSTAALSTCVFKKDGYHFIGWSTSNDLTVEYQENAAYTMGPNSFYTLYAVWKANTNTLLFDANTGTGTMNSIEINTDESISLPKNTFVKEHYHFVGWSTEKNSNVEYQDGAKYVMGSNNTYVLYAVWEENDKTLIFNGNGHTSGSMSEQYIKANTSEKLNKCSYIKDGYTFVGWSTSTDKTVEYQDESVYTMGQNLTYTLYAVWEANSNTLSFNSNGGNGTMLSKTVKTDETIVLPKCIMTKDDCVFTGWSTSSNGEILYLDEDTFTMDTTNVVLYAIWEINTYGYTFELSGDASYYSILDYKGNDEDLIIPEVFLGIPVTTIKNNAFDNCMTLKTVTIPTTITTIEDNIFVGCNNLESLTIPFTGSHFGRYFGAPAYYANNYYVPKSLKSVTITKNIADRSFSDCEYIENVVIAENAKLGRVAFEHCVNLRNVRLPDSLTFIPELAFNSCHNLVSITIPKNITGIGGVAFGGCDKLVEIINKSSMSNEYILNSGGSATDYSIGKYALTIHNGDSKIESINEFLFIEHEGKNYLLRYDGSKTNLVLPDSYKGQPYEIYRQAFTNSFFIENVIVSDGVEAIGERAFEWCTNLSEITIGSRVARIDDYAFTGQTCVCKSNNSYFTNNGGQVFDINVFDSIIVDEDNSFYKSVDNCLIHISTKTLVLGCDSSIIPLDGSVEVIASGAFACSMGINKLTLPNSLKKICTEAFWACNYFKEIVFDGTQTEWESIIKESSWGGPSSVSYLRNYTSGLEFQYLSDTLGYAVSGYNGTSTSVVVPNNYNGKSVSKILASAFQNNSMIEQIIIPNSVIEIEERVFYGCNSLRKLTVPFIGKDRETPSYLAYFFGNNGSYGITGGIWQEVGYNSSICTYIPKSLDEVHVTDAKKISNGTFGGLSILSKIVINEGVTSIGEYAFKNCSNISEFIIPNTTLTIGVNAFEGCSSLLSIIVPNNVSAINDCTFFNCSNLASVTIGSNVSRIGEWAFSGCDKLSSVVFRDTTDWYLSTWSNYSSGGVLVGVNYPEKNASAFITAFSDSYNHYCFYKK